MSDSWWWMRVGVITLIIILASVVVVLEDQHRYITIPVFAILTIEAFWNLFFKSPKPISK